MTQEEFINKLYEVFENEFVECVLNQANAIEKMPDQEWIEDVLIEIINGILPDDCQINSHNVFILGGAPIPFYELRYQIMLFNVCYNKSKDSVSFKTELQFTH